jgi:16S rRNA (cytosine967-C5)-methyltransferase
MILKETPEKSAQAALVVGLYQLAYLDRVPDYAIVDESVRMAKKLGGPPVAGWVNAILRKAADVRDTLRTVEPDDPKLPRYEKLAITHSHPTWMVSRWLEKHSRESVESFLIWNNRRPRTTIRINRGKVVPEQLTQTLTQRGVAFERIELDPAIIELEHGEDPSGMTEFKDGLFTIQDRSQGLVARLVDARAGDEILDLCAAPGGKSGHLAELYPEAKIVATDRTPERLDLIRQLIDRNGYSNVEVVNYEELLASRRLFDVVLVDAPCTGTGVLSRRPDLRWRRSPDDVRRMAGTQTSLLRYASGRLRPGGKLVYSTCSIEPEENQDMISAFLSENRGFEMLPLNPSIASIVPSGNANMIEILGPEIGGDGVFAVAMQKKKD